MTTFEIKDNRDDVKLGLPEGWKLVVVKLISGDSGKTYWIQVLRSANTTITMCNCNSGYFQLPLSVLGLGPCCKHAEWVLAYLKERGK